MSTDLELLQGLPKIQLQPISEVRTQQLSEAKEEDGGAIQLANDDNNNNNNNSNSNSNDDDDECRTPKSDDHKIPSIQSCPPAPRKSRRVVLCKRKLSELQFFEIVGGDEVEAFFRSSFETPCLVSGNNKKRRCGSK